MNKQNKTLICITGMDGTGKTTLTTHLNEYYPDSYVSDIWDLMKLDSQCLPFSNKKAVDNFLCSLTPDSRLLFLAHTLKYATDKALKSNNNLIILNGYYYKYFASELALGADESLVDSLVNYFPKPHLIIKLTTPIEDAANRKSMLSKYECGLNNATINNFIDFQRKIAKTWNRFKEQKQIQIATTIDKESVFEFSVQKINEIIE